MGSLDVAAGKTSETEQSRLSSEERRLLFRGLKQEVIRVFRRLDAPIRSRWVASARKLLEVLRYFEADPTATLACTMEQAVELACEFIAQTKSIDRAEISATLH